MLSRHSPSCLSRPELLEIPAVPVFAPSNHRARAWCICSSQPLGTPVLIVSGAPVVSLLFVQGGHSGACAAQDDPCKYLNQKIVFHFFNKDFFFFFRGQTLHRSRLVSLQMKLHQDSWGGSKFFLESVKGEFSCCLKRSWGCQQGMAWHPLGKAGLQS